MGRFYFGQKDYAKSVVWLRKLATSDENYRESLFLLGVGEYFLGHDAEAQKAFAEIARQLPLNEIYNNLGVMEFHRGRYAEALQEFDRAHAGDVTDSQFSFNRAACLWFLKKYDEAARALREDLQADEDDAEAHLLLAGVLEKLGDSAGSEREKKWLADHEDPSSTAASLGADDSPQPRLKKNYDGRAYRLLALAMRNALEARLSTEPPAAHAAAHIARSRSFINEHRYVEAERELSEAVSLAPENNEARLLLTQVYEAQGRHQEAAAQLEASLSLDDNAGAQLWLARIYLSLDRLQQAEQHIQAALALEPENQDAERLIHEIHQRNSTSGSAP